MSKHVSSRGNILDGKALAGRLRAALKERTAVEASRVGRAPGLDVVLVGDDPASHVYVKSKERAAAELGFASSVHRLPSSSTEQDVTALVRKLSATPMCDGILVQMPLPSHMHSANVIEAIAPEKDVDGLTRASAGALLLGEPGLRPCTPRGCLALIAESGMSLSGAHAVVVGRSILVGKPVAQLLLAADATVTVAHSRTKNLSEVIQRADVVIAAVGKPNLVRGEWIREGAVVIDVGINRTSEGSLVGDVEFATARERASFITPVPGGVGPMTIAMLLDNTLQAFVARTA